MNPYVIWSPDYRSVSGGIRVLYLLGHLLRERGFQAEMKMTHNPYNGNPWNVPEVGQIPDNAIHVYPEIITHNPGRSHRYVRWLLNHADLDGLKFVWNPKIGPWPVLNVPYLDLDVFYPGTEERSGVLVWHGKTRMGAVPEGAKVITYEWPSSKVELADELRRAEWLLAYDGYSAVTHEATICGCPVVVADPNWSLDDLQNGLFGLWGVVSSEDQLPKAKVEVKKALQDWLDYHPIMESQLDRFIEETQAL